MGRIRFLFLAATVVTVLVAATPSLGAVPGVNPATMNRFGLIGIEGRVGGVVVDMGWETGSLRYEFPPAEGGFVGLDLRCNFDAGNAVVPAFQLDLSVSKVFSELGQLAYYDAITYSIQGVYGSVGIRGGASFALDLGAGTLLIGAVGGVRGSTVNSGDASETVIAFESGLTPFLDYWFTPSLALLIGLDVLWALWLDGSYAGENPGSEQGVTLTAAVRGGVELRRVGAPIGIPITVGFISRRDMLDGPNGGYYSQILVVMFEGGLRIH